MGIAGDRVAIHETQGVRLAPYTLWGEIAYQIGGEALYQAIGPAATSFGSPADEYFDVVFKGRRVLIMLDELNHVQGERRHLTVGAALAASVATGG